MSISRPTNREPAWAISAELRRKLLAALTDPDESRPTISYEEFLDWLDEDTLAEWVDGKVIMASPASLRHQDIANFLLALLSGWVRYRDAGRVVNGPFQMKLEHTGREPDVLFVGTAHLDRLAKTHLEGPADIAVEVMSPESIGRDRGDKFYEYQKAGIPEYWLIDPETERAEFYQLNAKGAYQLIALDEHGVYHSSVLPGLWLREAWFWELPLPPPAEDVLEEIGGEEYTRYIQERRGKRGH